MELSVFEGEKLRILGSYNTTSLESDSIVVPPRPFRSAAAQLYASYLLHILLILRVQN